MIDGMSQSDRHEADEGENRKETRQGSPKALFCFEGIKRIENVLKFFGPGEKQE
jgi:hypothetical protein